MNFNITPDEAKKQFTTLSFKGKRIVADLFGRHSLTFVAEIEKEKILLSYFFTVNGKEIQEVDHLFQGPPLGIIKGVSLYFIETFAPYSLVKSCPKEIDLSTLKELIDEYPVIVLGDIPKEAPRIKWLDPYGMTVELLTPAFEGELLKIGYQKKAYHYYCKKPDVFKTTEHLKKEGWVVLNPQEKEVIPLTHTSIKVSIQDQVEVTGSLSFGNETLDISRPLQLESGKVPLLPDDFKYHPLLKKGVRKEGKLVLPKLNAGLVLDKFNPPETSAPSFKGDLRPYQKEGLNWLTYLYEKGFSGLLADDMGLGKTVQTIAFLSQLKGPILIVAPTSLLINWQREIERFSDLGFVVYHGLDRSPHFNKEIVITSYAIVRRDLALFQSFNWEAIIVDEAQMMKNSRSQTFQAIQSLKTKFKLLMTGTPIENNLDELKTHFKFLLPDLIDSSDELGEIKDKIAPYTLRRLKSQVLKDLPERIDKTLFVEMSPKQEEAYLKLLERTREDLEETQNPLQILELILRLRQVACHPKMIGLDVESSKMDLILNDIHTLLAEKQKIIVFSQFTRFLMLIREKLEGALYFDGETKNRQEIIDSFQEDDSKPLLLMSLKAGGVGLNLTRADQILLIDPWWNEAVENQAISRSHRMGRKEPVFVRRYVTINTIEEKIELLKRHKSDIFNKIFNNTEFIEKDNIKLLI